MKPSQPAEQTNSTKHFLVRPHRIYLSNMLSSVGMNDLISLLIIEVLWYFPCVMKLAAVHRMTFSFRANIYFLSNECQVKKERYFLFNFRFFLLSRLHLYREKLYIGMCRSIKCLSIRNSHFCIWSDKSILS